jgi:zinc protease
MINYEKFTLNNGLTCIVHQDKSTPIAAFNILYDVGSRDEEPDKTGFAHLFEHLMFGGSVNIPDFDKPLQQAGGSSNAFTSNDITNYYETLPLANLETAFWLESDRMLSLAFTPKSLEVQKNVVIEEFKQRYLNQPYGDVWLLLRPLAYTQHPYQWPTIGKEISHIENATLDYVKHFFYKHYTPQNAILCVAGNVNCNQIKNLCEKWFADIPTRNKYTRHLPKEPQQTQPRHLTVERDVPYDAIYKAWHIPARHSENYYACDLISDILGRGNSSRLYQELVKKQKLFSEIHAYVTGDLDEGLLIVSGKLHKETTIEQADDAIKNIISQLIRSEIDNHELEKVKNQAEATKIFAETNILNKAMSLCYAQLMGNIDLVNTEMKFYRNVSTKQIFEQANIVLNDHNCSTLYYLAKK